MIIKVLDETGHTVMTDAPETTKDIEGVKEMTSEQIEKEFNELVKEGYTPLNDKTNKFMKTFDPNAKEVTMLYPAIGG